MSKKAVKQQSKRGVSKKGKPVSLPLEEAGTGKPAQRAVGSGTATRIDLDYIFGSSSHCFWAIVSGGAYHKWMNDDQVKTIAHAAFAAPQVSIQYNSSTGEIERIRPIKNFWLS